MLLPRRERWTQDTPTRKGYGIAGKWPDKRIGFLRSFPDGSIKSRCKATWLGYKLPTHPYSSRQSIFLNLRGHMADVSELSDPREVEFYAASVNAFYNTSLEYDKGLFALSAGGLGLLVTLLTTVGIKSRTELAAYCVGILCFTVALILLLVVFRKNKQHIVAVVSGDDRLVNTTLARLDAGAMCAFGAGAICAGIVGVHAAFNSYHKWVDEMANNKKATNTKTAYVGDSVDGIRALRPDILQKSFNGAEKLRPQTTGNAAASVSSNAPTTAASSAVPTTPTASPSNPPNSKGK